MNPLSPTFWLLLAIAALVAEFFTGSFYLLVVACALAVIGLVLLLGGPPAAALLAGSAAGVAGLALLWRVKRRRGARRAAIDDPDLGQPVEIVANRDGHGTVRYRGAEWQADFEPADLAAGTRGLIVGRDGNRLKIVSPTQGSTP
ncbi:NfeD family protein [Crenobacter luteus]|uniref:NfeD-like C-terminal domain-containing protein n=1 Tax=Crenobacter luteus TaxID=1452487 RepID=A0A165EKF7_9NEIS|nr:NfeD family protein [Crenobacter luteus]KZE25265.1 hypothetical protein AVW16_02890 [Crenobacter luteus]